jgi:uncharacterized delta-60 repeat protein
MRSDTPPSHIGASYVFARAASKAKAKARITLFSAAVMISCWASGLRPAVAQSALDGFDPNANGTINAIAVQADGKILIGGGFTKLAPNGGAPVTRNHIARLNPDGTLDTAFDPNANATVWAIAVQSDGRVLVGGEFNGANCIGGQTRNFIARLDPTTGLADSFDANLSAPLNVIGQAPPGAVFSIAVQPDAKILIGGNFFSVGGQPRHCIARLDPTTGLADSFNPNASGLVLAIAVQADGKVLAGGEFSLANSIGGQMRNGIARLDPTTGAADSFNPNANGGVLAIAVQADGKILVGGEFFGAHSIGAQRRNYIARLDPVTGLADSFDPNANAVVLSLGLQSDGKILVGGYFNGANSIGGATRNFISRLDPTTASADSFNPDALSGVDSIAVQSDGKILAGGEFTSLTPNGVEAITRHGIARLEIDGRLDQTLDLSIASLTGVVLATAVQPDGKILVGGSFTNVLGVTRNNIARLNTDGTLDTGFDPNANGQVESIAVQPDGKILVGGYFHGANGIGGQPRNFIARLDATTGLPDSFDPNGNGNVWSIAVQADGKILVAGLFQGANSIGGQTRNHIARLDPTTGLADSFDPNANADVQSIAVQSDGKILAGGYFHGPNSIGGLTRNYIARLDPATGLADSFDPNANSAVLVIVLQQDGRVLTGGNFNGPNSIGGQMRNHVARIDPATGTADSFDPNANDLVFSIALQSDGKVILGGYFTTIGGQTRNRIARLDPTSGAADSFNPSASANNSVYSIALQSDGKILAGGDFTNLGGQSRNLIARLSNDTAALQNLAATQNTITWTGQGSSPQFSSVTFESSTDNLNYTSLGNGSPSGSNWTLTGLNLATGSNIYIRARGYYSSGFDGSESISETVHDVFLPVNAPATSISGEITTPEGGPLGGVTVSLLGSPFAVTVTNGGGLYGFSDLTSGAFYIVVPSMANYTFAPQLRPVSLVVDQTEINFTAIPNAIPTQNPLDTPLFFVRQQYLDFLGREPDAGGLAYWTGQLNLCGSDTSCINQRRIDISAAYFMSDEFQQTAQFVYLIYQGALGRRATYAEFSTDRLQLVANPDSTLDQLTARLAWAFVQRPEFVQKYPAALTGDAFVDALLQAIRQSSGVDLSIQRAALLATYNTGPTLADSRGLTVKAAINNAAFTAAEYNPGFVLTQYFGYLRRDPDQAGYDFWVNVLNHSPSSYHGMVCSFVTSAEYQQRFAPVVTHTNAECGP